MATVKIDTAVDAAAFQAFYQIFAKFQAGVEAQPDAWGKVAAAGGEARGTLEDAARSVRTLADNMDDVLARVKGLDTQTEKVGRRWTQLARGTKQAAGHIKEATGSLLKWAGITGLVAGVAGFGAEHLIFGLGRTVSANRTTAMGLGTTYGGLSAARLAYERYGDAQGLLGRITEAQGDPSKRLPFGALGMQPKDYEGRDSADVMADVMRRAKTVLDKVPDDQLGNRARTTHLDEFFSLEEMRRIKNSSREELDGQAGAIGRDRAGLELSARVQRQWQDFTTQMSRAGTTIETVFVNRLVALEPGLLKLSEAATKIAQTLLAKDGPVAQWLGEVDHGLEWLAKNIDDPKFQKQVGDFMERVGEMGTAAWELAKGAANLLHWFAKLVGSDDAAAPGADGAPAAGDAPAAAPSSGGGRASSAARSPPEVLQRGDAPRQGGRRGFSDLQRPTPSLGGGDMTGLRAKMRGGAGQRGAWWTDERMKHAYKRLTDGGLSPLEAQGQIARMAYVEAGSGPTASNNIGGGHLGIYQASRDRQRNFGGSTDFDAQLDAIAKEKATTEARSHGIGKAAKTDYDAAVAASAFERGEGYDPRSGRDNFTGRTMAAVPEVRGIVAPEPKAARVTVSKNTGGNPTASAAMAAVPQ